MDTAKIRKASHLCIPVRLRKEIREVERTVHAFGRFDDTPELLLDQLVTLYLAQDWHLLRAEQG